MRAGMMNGTLLEALPKASRTMAQGSFNTIRRVLASGVSNLSTKPNKTPPMASRLDHRFKDAATSSLVTGLPSWKAKPGRSLKVQVLPSLLVL